MNTFLPYPDFEASARCLDRARLGKQRVECLQLLRALADPTAGWRFHPACAMWRGCEWWLQSYAITVCTEWQRRGYRDTVLDKLYVFDFDRYQPQPSWLGGPIHASHRSNLLRKDPAHYGQFGWSEGPELPYYWPTRHA